MPTQVFRSSSNCRQTRLPDSTFMQAVAALKQVYGQEPANEAQVVRMCIEIVAAAVPELSQVEVDAIGTALYTKRKPVMITNFEHAAAAQHRARELAGTANQMLKSTVDREHMPADVQQSLAELDKLVPVSSSVKALSAEELAAQLARFAAADTERQTAADRAAGVSEAVPEVDETLFK